VQFKRKAVEGGGWSQLQNATSLAYPCCKSPEGTSRNTGKGGLPYLAGICVSTTVLDTCSQKLNLLQTWLKPLQGFWLPCVTFFPSYNPGICKF